MTPLIVAADKNYLVTGVAGMAAGWGGALVSWLNLAGQVFTILGVIFGTVAAFFSMMILIRKYRNNKD